MFTFHALKVGTCKITACDQELTRPKSRGNNNIVFVGTNKNDNSDKIVFNFTFHNIETAVTTFCGTLHIMFSIQNVWNRNKHAQNKRSSFCSILCLHHCSKCITFNTICTYIVQHRGAFTKCNT